MSKLNLDRDRVLSCRHLAAKIARQVQDFVDRHTTVSIERAVLRLIGIEEAYKGRPLVNAVIDAIPAEKLGRGVLYWIGRALNRQHTTPIAVCLRIAEGRLKIEDLPEITLEELEQATNPLAEKAVCRLQGTAEQRKNQESRRNSVQTLKCAVVSRGDVNRNLEEARAAVQEGTDSIALFPNGEAAVDASSIQANLRSMKKGLDELGKEIGRPILLVNFSSDLSMPEIAVVGAAENIDSVSNDAIYEIVSHDLNMKSAFVDQYFSRLVIAHSGISIITEEGNYLSSSDSNRAFSQLLASLFINEQFARLSNLEGRQLGLSHAFGVDPDIEDSLLCEIAQAEVVRELFPRAPICYMPSKRYASDNGSISQILDAMCDLVGAITHQDFQLTVMSNNASLQERVKATGYISKAAKSLGDEISWHTNGKVIRRARSSIDDAHKLLQKIAKDGLMKAISQGAFAGVSREEDGGKGFDGLIKRDDRYWNPILKLLEKPPAREEVAEHEKIEKVEQGEEGGQPARQRRGQPRRRRGQRSGGRSGTRGRQ